MTATLYIKKLQFDCIIGVLETERHTPQPLIIDLAIEVDIRGSLKNEDLAETIDYGELAKKVREHCVSKKYRLIEAAAANICRLVLSDPKARKVTVTVTKPDALGGTAIPAIELSQSKV